jgi:hypothetical protein
VKMSVVQRWLNKVSALPSHTVEFSMEGYRCIAFLHNLLPSERFCLEVHKVSDSIRKNCLGWVWSQSWTVFLASSSANHWPPGAPIRGPNRWKSEDARFGLYAGLLRGSNFSCWRFSVVWAQVCA